MLKTPLRQSGFQKGLPSSVLAHSRVDIVLNTVVKISLKSCNYTRPMMYTHLLLLLAGKLK